MWALHTEILLCMQTEPNSLSPSVNSSNDVAGPESFL